MTGTLVVSPYRVKTVFHWMVQAPAVSLWKIKEPLLVIFNYVAKIVNARKWVRRVVDLWKVLHLLQSRKRLSSKELQLPLLQVDRWTGQVSCSCKVESHDTTIVFVELDCLE